MDKIILKPNLQKSMKNKLECCLCGEVIQDGIGNNPAPFNMDNIEDRCCDKCNQTKVIPERIVQLISKLN